MTGKKVFLSFFLFALVFCSSAFAQFDMKEIAVMQGAEDSLRFGYSLAGVGDINQDGFENLAVGQRWKKPKTFIYLGSKNFDTTADFTFPFFSWHIGYGDMNGDSISDLLLTPMGKIYIYYGGIGFDTVSDDSVVNNADYFGWHFACGDINKDGHDDLAVWGGYTKVFVYLGGDTISKQPVAVLEGPPNYFGDRGLSIGDINGDGYEDIAVSTSERFPDDSTYIYFGGVELDTVPRLKLEGGGVVLGDMNGDGYADLIAMKGTYFGGTVIDSVVDVAIISFGCSSIYWTIVGEFNKDRFEDLLLGSTSIVGGDATIYLGDDLLDTVVDWHYRDYEVGDYGAQVAVADINRDGVDEAIVGDPGWWYNNPSYPPGRVYIYDNPYTVVEDEPELLPTNFTLYQNYPNPFNSTTIIPYRVGSGQWSVTRPFHTTLMIYNVLGQKIRTLVNEEKLPGDYKVVWDGKDDQDYNIPSGIYFYKISTQNKSDTKKLILMK